MQALSPSIRLLHQGTSFSCRILCFPYAGGGANIFRSWGQDLVNVELSAIQLPGREWRGSEPPFTNLTALVEYLLADVATWLDHDGPNFFFGYSMGAILAYELAIRLKRIDDTGRLDGLYVAACRAPQLGLIMPNLSTLNPAEFLAAITDLGGIPDIVLAEPDLLQIALPVLRADFAALDTYRWQDHDRLACPLTVYGGSDDPLVSREDLAAWRQRTEKQCRLRLFSGGHFFINSTRGQLLKTLAADLVIP